jgi:peptide/nickel transport system permease protein
MGLVMPERLPERRPGLMSRGAGNVRGLNVGNKIAIGLLGLVVLVALAAPVLAPYSPTVRVGEPFLSPGTSGFLLGTDESGRDVLSRLLYGFRASWWSTVIVIVVALIIGSIVGTIAGATGGKIDAALMRLTDVFLAMPGTLLAIAVVAAFGPSLQNTLVAVAIVWWPWYARIVRNEIWALSARPHLEAARLARVSRTRRATRHLFPGVVGPLLVTAALDGGALLVTLAALSFFGLGAPPPQPELGAMTARGLNYLLDFWWIPVVPALAVALLAFVANLGGEVARSMMERR